MTTQKYTVEDYIQDSIISHFEQLVKGAVMSDKLPWFDIEEALDVCIFRGTSHLSILHRKMIPYYEMFLFGDERLCNNNIHHIRQFLRILVEADQDFKIWVEQQDIISATEGWGVCLKRMRNDHVGYYFDLLEMLLNSGCRMDWVKLSEELKEMLFKSEAYSDYKTDELLCILHAFTMIKQQEWTETKQHDIFNLLEDYWSFLKYFYSIMIRHIVGSRLPNFISLSNAVLQTNTNHPHLHIYYCGLLDRVDSLNLDVKKIKKMDEACLRLREVIDRNEPSDILYELCDVVFPEDFQRMLNEHRPKSYGELEVENSKKDQIIRRMEDDAKKTNDQIKSMTATFKAAIEASIPVEDIKKRLMMLPAYTAWGIFDNLCQLLRTHSTWRKYDVEIHEALQNRLNAIEERQDDLAATMKIVAARPTNFNMEIVQNKEMNIDNNYAPNIEHNGGTLNLPETV